MNTKNETDLKVKQFVNLSLPHDHESQAKFIFPGADLLVGYIISQVSKFLLEETIGYIKSKIYEKGLLVGTQILAFEIFKYFFADKNNLVQARELIPNFLNAFLKYSSLIPSVDISDVEDPEKVIESIRSIIMKSSKPFTVNSDLIIEFIEDKSFEQELNESFIKRCIKQSVKDNIKILKR